MPARTCGMHFCISIRSVRLQFLTVKNIPDNTVAGTSLPSSSFLQLMQKIFIMNYTPFVLIPILLVLVCMVLQFLLHMDSLPHQLLPS
mgnify:CR=1 FL=1